MSRLLIEDGMTRAAKIVAAEQVLEFSFRPMMAGRCEVYLDAFNKAKSPTAAAGVRAGAIAKQLTGWSEVDAKGEAVPHEAEQVLRLPYPIQRRMLDIVMGFDAGDTVEGDTPKESADVGNDLLAIAEGKNVIQEAGEAIRKN